MKLKKEVKEVILFIIFGVVFLFAVYMIGKTGMDAYNDCMSKYNDSNYCHKLME